MVTIVKPPYDPLKKTIFLAGSIEMGVAENRQDRLTAKLDDLDVIVFNPRRDHRDDSRVQSIDDPHFRGQVERELDHLEKADLIVFYFDPQTKSPVTLMELGLFARSGKVVVCCPDWFRRKGNVDIVCRKYRVPMVETLDELAGHIAATMCV